MQFVKAHGAGNDFVVLADLEDRLDLPAEVVRQLCDRRTGVGADGVLRIGPGFDGAHVFMDYRNADGSIGEMCGNGVRVVAHYVRRRGLVPAVSGPLLIGTRAGIRSVTAIDGDQPQDAAAVSSDGHSLYTVDMGPPAFAAEEIPFTPDHDVDWPAALPLDGTILEIAPVSMGNPHAVTLVDDVHQASVRTLGPAVETHDWFPERTNVEFAEVVDDQHLRLRVWERGVGETQACGTGACAAVAALHRRGLVGTRSVVDVPGGRLEVRYDPVKHPSVFLRGPAVEVFAGEVDAGALA